MCRESSVENRRDVGGGASADKELSEDGSKKTITSEIGMGSDFPPKARQASAQGSTASQTADVRTRDVGLQMHETAHVTVIQ